MKGSKSTKSKCNNRNDEKRMTIGLRDISDTGFLAYLVILFPKPLSEGQETNDLQRAFGTS